MATLDPRSLRALAHPVRLSLLRQLAAGPARVSDLAAAVGEPGNSVSFHLRQLGTHGFVRPAEGHGTDRRESWWEATTQEGYTFDPADEQDLAASTQTVATVLATIFAQRSQRVLRALDSRAGGALSSTSTGMIVEAALRLTPEQAAEVHAQLSEVVRRWEAVEPPEEAEVITYTLGIDFFADPPAPAAAPSGSPGPGSDPS